MRIAMLSPIAQRIPPRIFGPQEQAVFLLTEALVARGIDVTLFATANSETKARRHAVVPLPYEEDMNLIPAVWESIHISEVFERAQDFDLIHNHLDFMPLTYSDLVTRPVLTTIQGRCSEPVLPVFKKYNGRTYYVSTSDASRSPGLSYVATVPNGIDVGSFTFNPHQGRYLLLIGDIDPDNGIGEAIEIAQKAHRDLIIAGRVTDRIFFETEVKPLVDGTHIQYLENPDPGHRDSLLGGASCLLYSLGPSEPVDLTAFQANACGTPVVSLSTGSAPEIITDGLNGFLVPSLSEAVSAVANIDSISRFECRTAAEKRFSADRMVEDYLAVYNTILEETKTEDRRPWGYYEIISDQVDHKVKRIVVYPGKRLSLQRHQRRRENWTIVSGHPIVTRDEEQISLTPGDSVQIPLRAIHRIFNPGQTDVVFVEVQTGDYFGEDDIERIEDDFGRV